MSCDAQIHIYGDPQRYPIKSDPAYVPPVALFSDAQDMHRTLGFSRTVLVQPTVYGSDHRFLVETLRALPDRNAVRATGIVDDSITDRELEDLANLGFRGARLNLSKHFKMVPSRAEVHRTLDRIASLGWLAKLHVVDRDLLEFSEILLSRKDITFVIDHMGRVDFSQGREGPVFQWMLDTLRNNENWWMMISNGNRISTREAGWDDAVPFGKALVEAAPDRAIWGSDWPHVQWEKRMMNDAETVELFYRYVDGDRGLVQKILVENPQRLFRFTN
jgi:predicted TIM-barrel fold metal-dependent hydrolase